ncbi:hypothetical protein FB567DRAFT_512409 [Paraphoma chrysanthemicola]|uniref:Uncharacterized protein n=1 Tax=Paraphoma chrysanthemicola TaxID=798071 RepID=A0A8K0RHY5_9PLEO|nr:hypothetical protein FB567DRAFT_512409 [Paraphoma chrysanthemicola]
MRLRSVCALLALATGAVAQTPIPPEVQNSVLLVLATALPPDQRNYALASQSAFASQMASSLAAGNTPAWYQALPSDVKSLLPALYPASATATPTPSASLSFSSVASVSASPIGVNSTSITGVRTPTLSATATRSSAAVATTNAAPYPSAALGAGVGAALGVLGMLAF